MPSPSTSAPRASRMHSSPRDQILPRGPHSVPPAWRGGRPVRAHETRVSSEPGLSGQRYRMAISDGGTILVENLPLDAGADDVYELFADTIGYVEDSYLVYNNQANSKGVAIVKFSDVTLAYQACERFHGKVIDSNRPLRVRVILDLRMLTRAAAPPQPPSAPPAPAPVSAPQPGTSTVPPSRPATQNLPPPTAPRVNNKRRSSAPNVNTLTAPPTQPRALFSRIAPLPLSERIAPLPANRSVAAETMQRAKIPQQLPTLYIPPVSGGVKLGTTTNNSGRRTGPVSVRQVLKKGPKRTAKRNAKLLQESAASRKWAPAKKTVEELDAEMEEWSTAKQLGATQHPVSAP